VQQQVMKQEVHPLMILSLMMASPKPSLDHSSCAHNVTLQKYFSHPSLVNYFFPTPTHKTKIGTANKLETTKKNKPHGPIIIYD
jgi:hypothetical protein